MPDTIQTFTVTFPDGKAQSFKGPSTMTDADVWARAQQERGFAEGRIPSTYAAGVKQSAGDTIADNSKSLGGVVGLVGALAGQPEIVAASPFVGREVQSIGERVAGRNVTPATLGEGAKLAVEGAAGGYGPRALGNIAEEVATNPNVPKVAATIGKGIGAVTSVPSGLAGFGSIAKGAWNGGRAGWFTGKLAQQAALPLAKGAVNPDTIKAAQAIVTMAIAKTEQAMQSGEKPAMAAMKASDGNPAVFSAIMSHFMKSGGTGPQGLLIKGNVDLYQQPKVNNSDGSSSTVDSISIGTDQGEILIPRVTPDGRHLSSSEAIAEYRKTGRHLGVFKDVKTANSYAEQLHNDYAAVKYEAVK